MVYIGLESWNYNQNAKNLLWVLATGEQKLLIYTVTIGTVSGH